MAELDRGVLRTPWLEWWITLAHHLGRAVRWLGDRLEDLASIATLLTRTIDGDHYPLSARAQTLKATLNKLRPELAREPLPPLKVYAPRERRPASAGDEIGTWSPDDAWQCCGGACSADRLVQVVSASG